MKLAALLFFLTIFSQVAAVVLRVDSWPLTNYPMFAENKKLHEAIAYRMRAIDCPGDYDIGNTGRPNWEPYQKSFEKQDWQRMGELAMSEVAREIGGCHSIQVYRYSLKKPFELGEIEIKKILEIDVLTRQIYVEKNI